MEQPIVNQPNTATIPENNNENQQPTNTTTTIPSPPVVPTGPTPNEFKKQFSQFKFYLDNIDEQQQVKIRGRLQLLLSSAEPFFSKKCTHVVTTQRIPGKLTALNENGPPVDPILRNAIKYNMKIWSLDHLNKVLDSLVYGHSTGHRANRKAIDKILKDEKKYGAGTNHGGSNSPHDTKKPIRPVFVPFKNYYISVEDKLGVHRPVAIKEYHYDYSWPYLKPVGSTKSPFTRVPLPPSQQQQQRPKMTSSQPIKQQQQHQGQQSKGLLTDKENNRPLSQQQQQQQQQQLSKQHTFVKPMEPIKAMIPQTSPITPIDPLYIQQQQQQQLHLHQNHHQSQQQSQQHPTYNNENNNDTQQNTSSQLKASGLCPSQSANGLSRTTRNTLTNSRIISTTSESTTKVYMDNAQAQQDERVARLDRRMVDNNRINSNTNNNNNNNGNMTSSNSQSKQLLKTATMNQNNIKETDARLAKEKQRQVLKQQQQKKLKQQQQQQQEMHWCENCSKRYSNLKEHIKEEAHQTFVKDQNNFSKFDELVSTIRRPRINKSSTIVTNLNTSNIETKNVLSEDMVVNDAMDIDP